MCSIMRFSTITYMSYSEIELILLKLGRTMTTGQREKSRVGEAISYVSTLPADREPPSDRREGTDGGKSPYNAG